MINKVHVFEPLATPTQPSIILLGPSSKDANLTDWRQEVITLLDERGFEGAVYIPEPRTRNRPLDYDEHLRWVLDACQAADVILFWVPRNMQTLPGLKTNVEIGMFIQSPKLLFGAPENAVKMRYIKTLLRYYNQPFFSDLTHLLDVAKERAVMRRKKATLICPLGDRDRDSFLHLCAIADPNQTLGWDEREFITWKEQGHDLLGCFKRDRELIGVLPLVHTQSRYDRASPSRFLQLRWIIHPFYDAEYIQNELRKYANIMTW